MYYIISTFDFENGKKSNEMTVKRSFNEFFEFHKIMKKQCYGLIIPPLPEKDL